MKLFFACLITILVSAFSLKAQDKLPPIYEIKVDTASRQYIDDKYWQLLEDPSEKLTIGQVSSPAFDDKFHTNTTRTKGYNYSITNYWLRYRIKNTLPGPVSMTIPENVAYAWLYVSQPGNKWKILKTGTMVPWSERDGLKRISRLVVTLAPGEEVTFYEKDVFNFWLYKPEFFQFSIGFEQAGILKNYVINDYYYTGEVINAIIFGFLLLACLTNLLFYRVVKERVYLYFAIFVLTYSLSDFFGNTDVLFREQPFLLFLSQIVFTSLSFFMMMHFVRQFLSTSIYTPRWDKFLIVLSYVQLITFIWASFLPATLSFTVNGILYTSLDSFLFVALPCIIGTLLFFIPRTTGATRLGIIATLPAFTWFWIGYGYEFICQTLNTFYKTPLSAFYTWLLNVGGNMIELGCFIWLVLVFSWILFKRFADLQQSLVQATLDREIERSQLMEKQNEELEQKVASRTKELSAANRELNERQEEITAQRDQLSETVNELKTTQQQLIQSEKLASLGELTAGIAHEIQNPLNFVNNFSEVSMELAVEIKDELQLGNIDEVIDIVDNIEQNLEKIIHHGKRADAIVKNMLQHSRNNSGEKHPTDINALADEYFRLSYHGLRAKDKSFNSQMATKFDEAIHPINLIPQDIGRVLLNLFNNAFYAVQQRKIKEGGNYKPEVTVSTATDGKFVIVKVTDNGIGIPANVKEKILQPFFTTKPAGEGTGLGLSLSYDILVKGHGGTMDISSKEGEYTEFTIRIPV